jgi:predicted PurR-regulated permease PerM
MASGAQVSRENRVSGEYWRNRIFFWLVFLVLIVLTILMVKPYITALVLSLIAVIMLTPLYNHFLARERVRGREKVAVSLTLLSFVGILVVPVFLVALVVVNQLAAALASLASIDLEALGQEIAQALEALPLVANIQPEAVNVGEGMQNVMLAAASALTDLALSLGASLPGFLIQGMLFIVIVAALLPHYKTALESFQRLSPLGYDVSELYSRKITAMVSSLIKGVFLIAVIQGAAMGVFFWIAGLPYVLMLTILSMLLAMIPLVGISWLAIAVAVISLLGSNYVQAIIVLVGFYGVVNWIDLWLRPRLLSEEASIPLALFLLSIFGGLAWAGVMGLFYGPVIMLLLVTTVQIYSEQYAQEDGAILATAIEGLRASRREDDEDSGS